MPRVGFISRFYSPRGSVIGCNSWESLYVMSTPIISRSICVVALDVYGLTEEMPLHSGIS
jgi:hypothetical protein